MRVVQLLPELNEGGVERGVVELSRELVKQGIESLVVSAGGKLVQQIEQDGGRHTVFDVASKNPLSAPQRIFALRRLLNRLQPDVIHARSRVPAWLAFLANRNLRMPFVTTVHGFNSVNPYSRIMTKGDRVICVSGAIKDYVLKHYAPREDSLRIIPRGVDLEQFHPQHLDHQFCEKFIQDYKLNGRLVISTVGRITQLKDLETFIRAIDLIRRRQPEALGLVVGGVHEDKRDYFAFLQKLVAELNLQSHVCFTGSCSNVAEVYTLSRVVVSGSKKPESFGRSAAEALAMGVPVVATNHGGILDIVIDGQTGFLFQVGDPADLADKLQVAVERSWTGLREFVVNRFTLEQMVEKTLEVYRELSPAPGQKAPK